MNATIQPVDQQAAPDDGRHTPVRPSWGCRKCGHAWPCAGARDELRAEYAGNGIGLSMYLAAQLEAVAHDLPQLTPDELFVRVLAWDRPANDPPPAPSTNGRT